MTGEMKDLPIVPDVANVAYYILREVIKGLGPPDRGRIADLALQLFIPFVDGQTRESAERARLIARALLPNDPEYDRLLIHLRSAFDEIDLVYDHNSINEL